MEYSVSEAWAELHKFLDEIKGSSFEEFLRQDSPYWMWEECDVPDDENCVDFFLATGATRLVFGSKNPDSKYIFKTLLEEDVEGVDYCANECFIYDSAVERGLEKWFAWTNILGSIQEGGRTIYAMARADVCSWRLKSEVYNSALASYCAEKDCSSDDLTSEEMNSFEEQDFDELYCILQYASTLSGWEAARELESFLTEFSVNDTHCGNWGYIGGNLVLTDYAGYNRDLVAIYYA